MIDSSAIEAVQYDAARQRLDIELTNRRVYRYFDVPLVPRVHGGRFERPLLQ
jgi:hypothetical protein